MLREHLNGHGTLSGLTAKQRQVLDLLMDHKTSKEIARELRISPHTVDQRIQFAKDKLGARSRSDVAVIYRRLLVSERMTYEDSGIASPAPQADRQSRARKSFSVPERQIRIESGSPQETEADYQVARELFEGRNGTVVRLVAIVAAAMLLMLLVVGGLTLLVQLSVLMAK